MTSGYAVATLAVFIISIFFVIYPVSMPTPRQIPRISLNFATAPVLAIAILWAAQCIDLAVIRNGIVGTEGVKPYNILILFFSLAYMAITLDITGVLEAAAFWVSNKSGRNGWKLYLYFYVMLTLLSILLGNDPVILSGTAFLVYYTQVAELDPKAWIMAEFAAANTASMVLFVGNPTNVVICEGFSINDATFTLYTILPFVACSIFCFAALVLQFRTQVPPKSAHVPHPGPRSALLDPFGAYVGSFMLGITLILCLVVSFFGIDVWMISLPFAIAKFLFDLGWDHYRYSRGIPMYGRGSPKVVTDGTDGADGESGGRWPMQDSPSHCLPTGSPTSLIGEETATESHLNNAKRQSATVSQPRSETKDTGEARGRSTVYQHTDESSHHPPSQNAVTVTQPYFEASAALRPTEVRLLPDAMGIGIPHTLRRLQQRLAYLHDRLDQHFPTFINALPRLPFSLVPFAFSQFILIEALAHQGWINVFANWLARASGGQMHPTIWLVGVIGVILCNLLGTNISAVILLTKVIRATALPYSVSHGAAIALVVASNIGAVSFTFSASLSGLRWRAVLEENGIHIRQKDFALWNLFPLLAMISVGLAVVSAEMEVLFRS